MSDVRTPSELSNAQSHACRHTPYKLTSGMLSRDCTAATLSLDAGQRQVRSDNGWLRCQRALSRSLAGWSAGQSMTGISRRCCQVDDAGRSTGLRRCCSSAEMTSPNVPGCTRRTEHGNISAVTFGRRKFARLPSHG